MKPLIKTFGIHAIIGVLTLSSLGIVYAAWNDDVSSSDTLSADRWNDLVTQVEGIGGGSGKFINGTDTNDAVYTTGNVGIGTNDPVEALDVVGAIKVSGNGSNVAINYPSGQAMRTGTTGTQAYFDLGTVTFREGNGGNGNAKVRVSGAASIGNGYSELALPGNGLAVEGSVGIGTTTPSGKLHVAHSGSNIAPVWIGDPTTISSTTGLYMRSSSTAYMGTGSAAGDIRITADAFGSNDNGITIENGGDVGIGTTSPQAKLDVRGGRIYIERDQGVVAYDASHVNNGSQTTLYGTYIGSSFTGMQIRTSWDGSANDEEIVFSTHNGGSSVGERMRIDKDGNVGIGTTSPQAKLDVNGSIVTGPMGANGSVGNTQEGIHISPDGYGWFATTSVGGDHPLYAQQLSGGGGLIYFAGGTTNVGSVTTDGTSTFYNTTSDYRLKENIGEISSALDAVMQLKPSSYSFISDTSGEKIDGFIAHEIQEILPYVVTGEKDATNDSGEAEYQQVDYAKLTPILTKAIQEQQEIIEELRIEIEALKQ